MTPNLRDYQVEAIDFALNNWAEVRSVMLVLPARSGKTVVMANLIRRFGKPSVVIAHRTELLSQASAALATEGIRHRVIGSDALRRECVVEHLEQLGVNYIDQGARVAIASVNTLAGIDPRDPWLATIGLALVDEGHHLLRENLWGRATSLLPASAKIAALTATPLRADGKGLGLHADGLIERMHVGPSSRDLIDRDYIADYRIVCSPSDVDLSEVKIAASGDFNPEQVRKAVHKSSRIVGDAVSEYKRRCMGLRGMTFCVDVDAAVETAEAFRKQDVPAEVVTGKTPAGLRSTIMRRYKARDVLQLVNVDLYGEGVNVPGMEVMSMMRPTASYGLYVQQFNRPLTKAPGKQYGWIIDHVGNVARHGLPDAPREWSLNRRERKSRSAPSDVIPTRTCLFVGPDDVPCANVYERVLTCCPECGHMPVPADRSGPDRVDGDLTELDPAVLAKLRGEIARVDGQALIPQGVPHVAQLAARKNHIERQQHQGQLRSAIALWAGWQHEQGRGTTESYRRFYFRYGVDVATACALGSREADELREKIQADLERAKVVDATVISE
jgi:superfamily II DNA or RNA helicase